MGNDIELHLDLSVKNKGFSGSEVYCCPNGSGSISLVSTTSSVAKPIGMILIFLRPLPIYRNIEIKLIGGPKERAEWVSISKSNDTVKTKFMFDLLFRMMTQETLFDILMNIFQHGHESGEQAVQEQIRKALGIQ